MVAVWTRRDILKRNDIKLNIKMPIPKGKRATTSKSPGPTSVNETIMTGSDPTKAEKCIATGRQ